MGLDTRIIEFNKLQNEELMNLKHKNVSEFNRDDYVTRYHQDYNNDFPYIVISEKDYKDYYSFLPKVNKYFKKIELMNDGYRKEKNESIGVIYFSDNGFEYKKNDSTPSYKYETFYIAKIREIAYWRNEWSISHFLCMKFGSYKKLEDGLIPGYLKVDRRIIDTCKDYIYQNECDFKGQDWDKNPVLDSITKEEIKGKLFLVCDY